MANSRSSFSNFLTVVAFLVLTVLAIRFYGNTKDRSDNIAEAQTNSGESSLYQKGQAVVDSIWAYAKVAANVNLIKNLGVGNANLGENIKKYLSANTSAPVSNSDNSNDSNENNIDVSSQSGAVNSYDVENNRPLVDLTKGSNEKPVAVANASDKTVTTKNSTSSETANFDLQEEISSLISYQKTSDGAEIIITSKSGTEYKLPLPFKFLAK